MCSIEDHDRNNPTLNYDTSNYGSGGPLPAESTTDESVLLGLTMNFIGSWLQLFKKNYLQQTTMYCEKMSELFRKIPVTIL